MQSSVSYPLTKRNYDFIDTIRCIAMIFIVMEHATYFEPDQYLPTYGLLAFCFFLSIQFSKFGTVCFFLLAGFLIGDKFTDYTPGQYLKRRLDSTIVPWLFWSVFFILLTNFNLIKGKLLLHPDPVGINVLQTLANNITTTYLYTNYWFIPNFLFCITLLLIFKKYLYSYKLGIILFLFTLFYSVNIYFSWIVTSHTMAILGFVFFLWLGAQMHKKWLKINIRLDKTSVSLWVILTILTLSLSTAEIFLLTSIHIHDPYNSLRFSNIMYSLCFFFLLLKIRYFKFIKFLKPRETTYGIYLIHYVILNLIITQIINPLNINVNLLSVPVILLFQLVKFTVVYGLTMLIIWSINALNLKWLIGR